MPKLAQPLTDVQARNAKPREKIYTLADGEGMYLEITPFGTKIWRMSYRQPDGKRTRLTLGSYPEVLLQPARQRRFDAQRLRAEGIDPAQARRLARQAKAAAEEHTFEAVAREWHVNKSETWKDNTVRQALIRLENDVYGIITVPYPALESTQADIQLRTGRFKAAAGLHRFSNQLNT